MRPTIKACSVKVMRSHDYCHFEICLSSEYEAGEILEQQVDELRKEAARLADKAVEQYKIAKTWASRNLTTTISAKYERLKSLAAVIHETPERERTPEEQSILKALANVQYEQRHYDYQDDWDEAAP